MRGPLIRPAPRPFAGTALTPAVPIRAAVILGLDLFDLRDWFLYLTEIEHEGARNGAYGVS